MGLDEVTYMLETLLPTSIWILIIFMLYTVVIIPIHEMGHMVAFRYYGVKSIIGLGSGNGARGRALAYCKPLFWADNLIFIEDDKKDAVVSFAGGGASIVFHLCMFILFPLSVFLYLALFEGLSGLLEVIEGLMTNRRIRQKGDIDLWYMESKEEHKIFVEEINRYEHEGLLIPVLKTYLRVEGFDLKEFE